MKKQFIIVFFLVWFTTLKMQAQDIHTANLEWSCASIFEAQEGVFKDEIAKIKSSAEEIVWYDKNGVVQKTFSIAGSSGTWTDISGNGSVVFNMTYGDNSGFVQFSKAGSTVKIRVHLINEEGSPIYEFTVATVTTL